MIRNSPCLRLCYTIAHLHSRASTPRRRYDKIAFEPWKWISDTKFQKHFSSAFHKSSDYNSSSTSTTNTTPVFAFGCSPLDTVPRVLLPASRFSPTSSVQLKRLRLAVPPPLSDSCKSHEYCSNIRNSSSRHRCR